MAYRLTYSFSVDWIGPGMGQTTGGSIYGGPSSGNAQTLSVFNKAGGQTIAGSGAGGIIQTADISTMVNAAATDIIAQLSATTLAAAAPLNTAPLPQMQGWASGQP